MEKKGTGIITRSSLTEQVYSVLKDWIVNRKLTGGAPLVERTLAEELNVSKTPVREAIARLEKEGLVEGSPGRTMTVRDLTRKEVEDILQLRMVLEGFAAELAARCITQTMASSLERLLEKSEVALGAEDLDRYKELDTEFHRGIRAVGGNKKLDEIMEGLENQIRIVMSTSVQLSGRARRSLAEHRAILQAIAKGDPANAGRLAQEHIVKIDEAIGGHGLLP